MKAGNLIRKNKISNVLKHVWIYFINQEIPIVHMYNDVEKIYPYIHIHIYEESKDVLLHLQENVACVCGLSVFWLIQNFTTKASVFKVNYHREFT